MTKKLSALIISLCLLVSCVSAITPEEEAIKSLIIQQPDAITSSGFSFDYAEEESLDNLTVTEIYGDESKIIFTFDCRAKEENIYFFETEYITVGNYRIHFYSEGEFFVYDKNGNTIYDFVNAYYNGLITDDDLDNLYDKRYVYISEEREKTPIYTDDPVNEAIREQMNGVYKADNELYIDSGEFKDLEVEMLYEDDKVKVFRYDSSTMECIDGLFEWKLGDYEFSGNTGDEIFAYDIENNKISFIRDAYNEGDVDDSILDIIAEKYLFNKMSKATMSKYYPDTFTLTLGTNGRNYGTVYGGGKFENSGEAMATVKAVANEGYEFVNWTIHGHELSKDAEATIKVISNMHVIANFKRVVYPYGDANVDGDVNIIDVSILRANIIGKYEMNDDILLLSDLNTDLKVDIVDVALLRYAIVNNMPIIAPERTDEQKREVIAIKAFKERIEDLENYKIEHLDLRETTGIDGYYIYAYRYINGFKVDDYAVAQFDSDGVNYRGTYLVKYQKFEDLYIVDGLTVDYIAECAEVLANDKVDGLFDCEFVNYIIDYDIESGQYVFKTTVNIYSNPDGTANKHSFIFPSPYLQARDI